MKTQGAAKNEANNAAQAAEAADSQTAGEEKLNLLMVDNHIPAGAKLY